MSDAIRIMVVDDHLVVRQGIRALLATEPGITVVAEASNGVEAIAIAAQLKPDVILMDLMMPQMDGITAIQHILADQLQARILVLTSFAADDKIVPAVRAGALGYILKDTEPGELVTAIHQVFHGIPSLDVGLAWKALQHVAHPLERGVGAEVLTKREREVLGLVGQGESNQQIARGLTISEATVRKHVSSILSKLNLASRTQAALYAREEGLTPGDDMRGAA